MIIPLPQIGWSDRLTYSGDTRTGMGGLLRRFPEAQAIWRPCGTCWGQRRILIGGVFQTCMTCLGIGEVPAVAA